MGDGRSEGKVSWDLGTLLPRIQGKPLSLMASQCSHDLMEQALSCLGLYKDCRDVEDRADIHRDMCMLTPC